MSIVPFGIRRRLTAFVDQRQAETDLHFVEVQTQRCHRHTDCLASPELARACWAARTKPPAPHGPGVERYRPC